MHVISNTHRTRHRRAIMRLIVSAIGLLAITILLYLIGHLPVT